MLFSTATTLTFGPMKVHQTVVKKYVVRLSISVWALCFTKGAKRGTVLQVFKQCGASK